MLKCNATNKYAVLCVFSFLIAVCVFLVLCPSGCSAEAETDYADCIYERGILFANLKAESDGTECIAAIVCKKDDGFADIYSVKTVTLGTEPAGYQYEIDSGLFERGNVRFMLIRKRDMMPLCAPALDVASLAGAREPYGWEAAVLNSEICENLSNAYTALYKNQNHFKGTEKKIVTIILNVLDSASNDGEKYLISTDSIIEHYNTEINSAKELYDSLDEDTKSLFRTKISNIDSVTFNFIVDFFDIKI